MVIDEDDLDPTKSVKRVLFRTTSMLNNHGMSESSTELNNKFKKDHTSFFSYLKYELTRDYQLEHDEERYASKGEKVYSFMRIPKEVERFMTYGLLQCTDSFLFICTFLPVRIAVALWTCITSPFNKCFGLKGNKLTPAKICDLLRAFILLIGSVSVCTIDPNILYHIIKSQSIIKLYLFFNMLEVADRLFSSVGQDAIDALFWTATKPKGRKREHLGVISHLLFAMAYVILHSILVMLQATTLNVAINSSNKVLLTIMMSNNFVELKGSVFKKFDKNNLFQLACSDVRERFHLCFLMSVVIVQTMKEYSWEMEQFWELLPNCIIVLVVEVLVDWIKHAFITKFNDLSLEVYRDYTTSLAYDMAQTRQKHAFTDSCDLVARRMGFIPLPLGVVLIRILMITVKIDCFATLFKCFLVFVILVQWKILNGIIVTGRGCDLITQHKQEKQLSMSPSITKLFTSAKDSATSPLHIPHPKIIDEERIVEIKDEQPIPPSDSGPEAIFTNSTVDLKNAILNEELLKVDGDDIQIEDEITKSVPNITGEFKDDIEYTEDNEEVLKRAESEPALNTCNEDNENVNLLS